MPRLEGTESGICHTGRVQALRGPWSEAEQLSSRAHPAGAYTSPPLVLTMTDAPPFVLDQAPEHCLPGSKCATCPGSSGADRATRIGGGDEEGQEEPARRMGLTERPDGSL